MRMEQYISQLLYRHQCVIVPGFGGFLTEFQSAKLVASTHTLYPPKKMISFNFQLKNNDGILANYITKVEKISFEKATEQIENEVKEWKLLLQNQQSLLLNQIGKLTLNPEGRLVFEPIDTLNYLTDAFGLTSIVSPPVKRELLSVEPEPKEEKPVIVLSTEKQRPNWFKYAAVAVVGLGISGFFVNQWHETKRANDLLQVEKAVQKKVEQKIQQATFFIDNSISSVSLTVVEEQKNYHIVAGAFRELKNAEKAVASLQKLGYNARQIEPNKHGLHPVVYDSYSRLEEAQQALGEIKANHNKEAWLLVQE